MSYDYKLQKCPTHPPEMLTARKQTKTVVIQANTVPIQAKTVALKYQINMVRKQLVFLSESGFNGKRVSAFFP